jgi:uncharacterized coiled-coil DUF342 family protein
MPEKEWDIVDSIESLSEDLKSESEFLTRIATAVKNLKDQRDKLLVDNERLRKQYSDEHNRAMTYMNDLMGANSEIECMRAERDKAIADNERLRESLASWEATWYLCHDGSESACCKDHD